MQLGRRGTVLVLGPIVSLLALTGCLQRSTAPVASMPAASVPAPTPAPQETVASTPPAQPTIEAPTASPAPTAGFRSIAALKDLHFGTGKSGVLRAETAALESVFTWLRQNPTFLVLIEGYTDDRGTREQNVALAEQRARAIMKYLVSKGIEADRITIEAIGTDRPICTDKTEACRAKNRRVEFLVKERD